MKDKLLKLLSAKKNQRSSLYSSMIECESKEERQAINDTIKALDSEIAEVEDMISACDTPVEPQERSLDVVGAMQSRGSAPKPVVNKFDSEEYRTAFMNYVCRGTAIPAEFRDADAITTTSDASAVIPTTILNEMVIQMKSYGGLWSRIRKINVQGGVKIPILSLKPTATWITADTGTSESYKQKLQSNTSVSFSYYGLECKIAQTLLVNVTTLAMFQELFATLAVEAIVKALDNAIMNGDGTGEPLGITADTRVQSSQKITISQANAKKWDEWKKQVFAKIPISYNNGLFIMAKGTFDGVIDGMVDSNGQPIGRVNYGIGEAPKQYFGGKEVLLVEPDIIKDWDTATGHASTGDVIAVYCNLSDYCFNSNLEMQTVKWVDHDTNEIKNKVILIGDGKLVDPNGVLIIKKGA